MWCHSRKKSIIIYHHYLFEYTIELWIIWTVAISDVHLSRTRPNTIAQKTYILYRYLCLRFSSMHQCTHFSWLVLLLQTNWHLRTKMLSSHSMTEKKNISHYLASMSEGPTSRKSTPGPHTWKPPEGRWLMVFWYRVHARLGLVGWKFIN